MKRLKPLASDTSPFTGPNAPRKGADVQWVKPQLVAEIEFAGWTGSGNVRQAAFKGLREDKPAREVVAERPASAEDTRREKTCTAQRAHDDSRKQGAVDAEPNVVMGVPISKPDKPLWPRRERRQAGHQARSRALLRERRRVADAAHRRPALLDHPRARRHRRAALLPASRDEGHVEPADADAACPAIASRICRSIASKAWQRSRRARRSELHPWNCEPGQPEVPGRLVFDLDPSPEVDFDAVIAAARELQGATRSARPRHVLQDDRRQRAARRDAARARQAQQAALARSESVRAGSVRADGRRQPRSLSDQHGEEAAHRAHLPRLSAQRPHGDRGRAAVAAPARRRARLDAADLVAGEGRTRSDALHGAHGAAR